MEKKEVMKKKAFKELTNLSFSLPPLSGDRLIYKASDVFSILVDPCFIDREITKKGAPTPETGISLFQLVSPTTFKGAFSDLPGTWEQKVLSQHQIIEIAEKWENKLSPKESFSLFLAKKNENRHIDYEDLRENLMIVMIERLELFGIENGLAVLYLELANFDVWFAQSKIRVIVPKI